MTANEFASYTYDAAGRITGITQQLWAQRTVTAATGTSTELYQHARQLAGRLRQPQPPDQLQAARCRNHATATTPTATASTAIDNATSDTDLDGAVRPSRLHPGDQPEPEHRRGQQPPAGFHADGDHDPGAASAQSSVTTPVNYAWMPTAR